jgi:hypothetical protein
MQHETELNLVFTFFLYRSYIMATDILCRFDPAQQTPVVFLRDSINGNKIQVWKGTGKPEYMPLDYYKMTSPLSADDERVLMERFKQATGKQDQVIRITHRMPRTSRPLPNMLAPQSAPSSVVSEDKQPLATQRKSTAKPIDAQNAPNVPTGDLPKEGEVPAPMPAATAPAPVSVEPNEPPSAAMFRRIKELNARMAELSATIQNATTDYEAAKQACKELTAEFEQQIERESQEELRKRKEMLAQVTGLSDPLATAAQALHDSATKPAEQPADPALAEPPKDEPKADAPAASKPRATGQARRAPAPAGKAKK